MSRNTGNISSSAHKGGNSLLTGLLIGMVVGVGMAAGLAWFIMKSPSPFVQKETGAPALPGESKTQIVPAKASAPAGSNSQATESASGVNDGKPRFEFYKVLTDKQDAAVIAPAKPAERSKPADSKSSATNEPQFLQAGSFSNASDADKIKAKLALLGIEASTQTATIPDKGVWYRVRVGPYKNADEMNRARSFLKQNGVDSTPMHPQ